MTMQASGQISLQDIRDEIDNDEDDFSLADANTGQYETINMSNLNANKPDNSTPHALSEWYKYQHSPTSISTSPGSNLNISSGGVSNQSISVTHRQYSTWYVSSKPSWVTITSGNYGSSNADTGSGTVTYNVSSNGGSSRSGTITVRCNTGTTNGTHPSGSNSFTTRNTSISQASGEGGGGGGGGGRGDP
jgi:hypothetical protein